MYVFFLLLLVLVVLHESEHRFALLNIITSAKFLSIFRNEEQLSGVSVVQHLLLHMLHGGGGGRLHVCIVTV